MTKKKNCWEFLKCGRERDGVIVDALGLCPAASRIDLDEINGGIAAGRFCWTVAGTLCRGDVQGLLSKRDGDCLECPFFQMVEEEEAEDFVTMLDDSSESEEPHMLWETMAKSFKTISYGHLSTMLRASILFFCPVP